MFPDSGKNKASALSPIYRFAVREADSSERLALKNVEIGKWKCIAAV